MIRFLLFLFLVYVLYRLSFGPPFRINFMGPMGGAKAEKKPRHPDAEEMVSCVNCGMYVSRREAVVRSGRSFCGGTCAASEAP